MSRVKMLAPVPATIELLKEQLLARNHDLFPPAVLQSYIGRLDGYAFFVEWYWTTLGNELYELFEHRN